MIFVLSEEKNMNLILSLYKIKVGLSYLNRIDSNSTLLKYSCLLEKI